MSLLDELLSFISPAVVWGIFFVVSGVYLVITLALAYHWKEYSAHLPKGRKVVKLYLLGSAVLLVVMFIAAALYVS